MTKIDFYTGSQDKLRTVCLLSHKAMLSGVRTVISTHDETVAITLDKMLWHYPATGFIPHARCGSTETESLQVILNDGSNDFPHHELLITLHDECTNFFSRFERVIEVIGIDKEDSLKGRERFKYYRDRGYELSHISLNDPQNR